MIISYKSKKAKFKKQYTHNKPKKRGFKIVLQTGIDGVGI